MIAAAFSGREANRPRQLSKPSRTRQRVIDLYTGGALGQSAPLQALRWLAGGREKSGLKAESGALSAHAGRRAGANQHRSL